MISACNEVLSAFRFRSMHLKADVFVTDGANCRLACSEVLGWLALRFWAGLL